MRSNKVFKQLREERGVSQRKLTKGICARSTLATFENEGSQLSVDLCAKLLDRLNIRINSYFNMFSEGFDKKRAEFSEFKDNVVKEDVEELQKKRLEYLAGYKETRDFYWFNLYLHAERIIFQLTDSFSYEKFKQTHKSDIDVVKKYLYNVQTWGQFEFAVFSNSVWYFDFSFIELVKERLEENYVTSLEYKKELYGSFLLNTGFYCLEYGYFDYIEGLKEELFSLSSYENIHWKIMSSFQLLLAEELAHPHSPSKEKTLSLIQVYIQMDEEDHYNNMIQYRERLMEKHNK